ncbi:MAG: hypothetical protein AB1652_00530 [Bacillota bacterium]
MSSRKEQRQQPTPKGGSPRKEAVNPPGAVEAPSSLPARPAGRPCEEAAHLLEKVLERGNMIKALRRVESNKGAPGIDGMGLIPASLPGRALAAHKERVA